MGLTDLRECLSQHLPWGWTQSPKAEGVCIVSFSSPGKALGLSWEKC